MLLWLEKELDQQNVHQVAAANNTALDTQEWCVALAHAGEPNPLRKLYPQFADCIYSPKLGRGQKYARPKRFDAAEAASDFAQRIRKLWRLHHHRQNRSRDEKSAEEFAIRVCRRWFPEATSRLTVDAVLAAGKPSGKHIKRRNKIPRQKAKVPR